MDTSGSERLEGEAELAAFNKIFEALTSELEEPEYLIDILVLAVHSEKVQKAIIDKQLERAGYDLGTLGERGVNFIRKLMKANGNKKGQGE